MYFCNEIAVIKMKKRRLFVILFILCAACMQAQQYKIQSCRWERIDVSTRFDSLLSPESVAILTHYKSKVDSIVKPALGLSRRAMSPGKPESLLGNWIADVIVEGGTATGLEPADMGLVNIGSLRSDMPDGIITQGNIIQISPFDNYIVVLEMRGKDMVELMREIAAVGGEAVSSSIRMEISSDGELLSSTIDGKEIDPKRIYKVATIDYLAEGNDGMTALTKAVKRHDIGILIQDIMSEYVIKHRVMDSSIEGRIKIKD